MNSMATRADKPQSRDTVFSMVALGILQGSFSEDVAQLFTDHKYGASLIRRSAVMHCLDPSDVDPGLWKRACSLLEACRRHLEQQAVENRQGDIPGTLSKDIIETFRLLHSGV